MTDILCSFLEFVSDMILTHFPDFSIGASNFDMIMKSLDKVFTFIAPCNFIIPLDTILLILSLVYGFKFGKFTLFLVNWIIRRIRGG